MENIRKALDEAAAYIGDRSAGSAAFWDALEGAWKELASLTPPTPEEVARAKALEERCKVEITKALTAESERDAARQTSDGLSQQVTALRERLELATSEHDALRAQVATVEKQRDAAQLNFEVDARGRREAESRAEAAERRVAELEGRASGLLTSDWPHRVWAAHFILTGEDRPVEAPAPRPAPRETLDRARVVEVLNDMREHARHRATSGREGQQRALGHMLAATDHIARELGLTLDTPPSASAICPKCGHAEHWDVGSKDRAPHSYCIARSGWSAPACGCTHRPETDTPPSGPGGGWTNEEESEARRLNILADNIAAKVEAANALEPTPEARNPRVTPDVPPLAQPVTLRMERGKCLGEPCTKDAPTVGAHLVECPASGCGHVSQPEPAAPEVVANDLDLDGDKYRVVVSDGHAWVECYYDGSWNMHLSDNQGLVPLLARALAESKREATPKSCGAMRDGRQCGRPTLAEPVPAYFVCEQCIAADAARKAAEAMRERIAQAVVVYEAHDVAFMRRLADRILALPLE